MTAKPKEDLSTMMEPREKAKLYGMIDSLSDEHLDQAIELLEKVYFERTGRTAEEDLKARKTK